MLLRLYSKRRCPLCEVATRIVHELARRYGSALRIDLRYIDDSPADYARFRYDVPVLFIDEERAFELRFTLEEVEARLRARGMRVAEAPPGDA
ncbi:MAG: glutaredoxin family protein [Myxococcaceae bacterium]|nr:glutaredoxin family protein [Myxococcaceae bacterium]